MPPFEPRVYQAEAYRSPYTAQIAQAMAAPGLVRAEGEARSGQISGQMWNNVGQIAGNAIVGTMGELLRQKRDAPRLEREQIALQQDKQQFADEQLARAAFQNAKGDPMRAVQDLENKGAWIPALKIRTQIHESRIKGLEEMTKEIDATGKRLGMATQLLQGLEQAPNPQETYKQILPRVIDIVGPELGQHLPAEYDPKALAYVTTWGMTKTQMLQAQRETTRAAGQDLRNAVTNVELTEKLTEHLAKGLMTVDRQEDWDGLLNFGKQIGGEVGERIVSQFPKEYSPESKAKVEGLLKKFATTATSFQKDDVIATVNGKPTIVRAGFDPKKNQYFMPGSDVPLEGVKPIPPRDANGALPPAAIDAYVGAVMANPSLYHDLTDSMKTTLMPSLHQAGFTPPPATDRGSSRAIAERWKFEALQKLEERRRPIPNMPGSGMTQGDYQREKAAIESSFRAQIGDPGKIVTPDPSTQGPPSVMGAPAARGYTNPPAQAPTAPQADTNKKAAATVPPDVRSLLQSQPPGYYTMTNGTRFRKAIDGTISLAPPK